MSPIDFDRLQAEHPEFLATWQALRGWFASNWRKQYVELSVLKRALKKTTNPLELILAISKMAEHGMLEIAYRVKSPAGDLLEGEYPRPDLVPASLPDRDHSGWIDTSEADVVSGYRWEPSSVA